MKRITGHIILLLIFLPLLTLGQTYSNKWVDYTRPFFKIKVTQDGLYRIPASTLSQPQYQAAGLDLAIINGSSFSLFNNGQVVPIYVSTTGKFGPNDFIEFYGKRNDGTVDTKLYNDPDDQPHTHISLFNDTAVYFLSWGLQNSLISSVNNDLTNLPSAEPYCISTSRQTFKNTFVEGKPNRNIGEPVFESIFDEGEGWYSCLFPNSTTGCPENPKNFTISASQLHTASGKQAKLKLVITGTSAREHSFDVSINSTKLTTVSFYDFKMNKLNFPSIPTSVLTNGTNTLTIATNAVGTVNLSAISLIELTYPRNFNFSAASKIKFALENNPGDKYLSITNFNSRNTNPILYDLENNIRLTGSVVNVLDILEFKLPSGSTTGGDRELYLSSQHPDDIKTITSMEAVNFIDYRDPQINQGDFIIITHSSLRTGNDYVGEYAKYRQSIAGGQHKVKIIDINQLYDQFAYGIRKHPLAIRNFVDFAASTWINKPEHIFLIGKGRRYNDMRNNASAYNQCKIPTFGHPGSDILLTATTSSFSPRVAIGRLSVTNPQEIHTYLEKITAFESAQKDYVGDPFQTIDEKAWMKEIIHLGGGEDAGQQTIFRGYLENYEEIIEDTLFGGHVTEFYKTSSNPIQNSVSDEIIERINEGVSLITFFGHSSANSFDIKIDNLESYTNEGKYPVILSNGCFTGNIYNSGTGISEKFVFAENKGAIGFISTLGLSSSSSLNRYSQNFYDNVARDNYGNSLGNIMKATVQDVESFYNEFLDRAIAEEMTLHGDPSIKLNPHAKPDYALEPQMVSFNPATVSISMETFELKVIVSNLGRAIDDSITLNVTRELPTEGSFVFTKRLKATAFSDTITFTIPTGSTNSFGLNQFYIKIDYDDEVDELSETNNELGMQLNIVSEDVFPVYPYEFAIVPNQGITLKASTANAFAETNTYIMEIDTTELFNSTIKRSRTFTQRGGLLKWELNDFIFEDSTVYYWRVRIDPATGANTPWHYSSFIYLDGSYPGWNQSHYYQFLKDEYFNMYLDNDRVFKLVDDVKSLTVVTGTANDVGINSAGGLRNDEIAYYLNGAQMHRWICGGGGFLGGLTFAVFDPATGIPWEASDDNLGPSTCDNYTINTQYHCIHCRRDVIRGFAFPTVNAQWCWFDKIEAFIDQIPDGHYVLVYSVNKANYGSMRQSLVDKITNELGSTMITDLANNGNSWAPWVLFTRKGQGTAIKEERKQNASDVINFNVTFNAQWYEGTITTPNIGPAREWNSFHWKHSPLNNEDISSIDVFGINNSGSEVLLLNNLTDIESSRSLQSIDPNIYPYLKLQLRTRDDVMRTPTQLDYWRILYKKVPEAALNPAAHLEFTDDISMGQELSLSVAVENLTDIPMDSLLIKYSIIPNGKPAIDVKIRNDSLQAFETMHAIFKYDTDCNCLNDLNSLIIEVNPDDDQPEQFHFNNIGILNFKTQQDRINPRLDVTFDGIHIMDGDFIAPDPEIVITLKDENKYLLLDDPSLITVIIKDHQTSAVEVIEYDSSSIQFIAPTSGENNKAQVVLKKHFNSGIYTIEIQAEDKSQNISGNYGSPNGGVDYSVTCEVDTNVTISNVLNYPNPFTSSTRFVFTVTGQVPSYFKIQILTISGKVVREVTQAELGQIRIGNNITDFAWDGTDQFGDPLANGLYLYRVIATLEGEAVEKSEKSFDKYFKSGYGKMYLAR